MKKFYRLVLENIMDYSLSDLMVLDYERELFEYDIDGRWLKIEFGQNSSETKDKEIIDFLKKYINSNLINKAMQFINSHKEKELKKGFSKNKFYIAFKQPKSKVKARHLFKENTVLENDFQRFKRHFREKKPMLFISGSRSENSEKQNDKNFLELKRYFGGLKQFDNISIQGSYVEQTANGNKEVKEKTLVVFAEPENEDDLRYYGIQAGEKFDQDSVLFVDTKGSAKLIFTSPRTKGFDKDKNVGKNVSLKDIEYFYSKIGKKKFTFQKGSALSNIQKNLI